METKKILNTCAGLITVGGASAGGYYALNSNRDTKITTPEQKNVESTKAKTEGTKSTKSIRQALIDGKLSPLSTKGTEDDRLWQNLIEKFISGNLDQSKKISAIIARTSRPELDGATNMKNLKEACDALLEKTEDTDFEKNKELASDWCTKESNLLKAASSLRRS